MILSSGIKVNSDHEQITWETKTDFQQSKTDLP